MYIYHALINALSAHMIHIIINLNTVFCTHVEHSPSYCIIWKRMHARTHEYACTTKLLLRVLRVLTFSLHCTVYFLFPMFI